MRPMIGKRRRTAPRCQRCGRVVPPVTSCRVCYPRPAREASTAPGEPSEADLRYTAALDRLPTVLAVEEENAQLRATVAALTAARGELRDAVREYLDAVDANDAEARRSEQRGAHAWSSAPMARMIDRLAALRALAARQAPEAGEVTDA
jgi:hypothetical protein